MHGLHVLDRAHEIAVGDRRVPHGPRHGRDERRVAGRIERRRLLGERRLMVVPPLHVGDVDERVRVALALRDLLTLEEIRLGIARELGRDAQRARPTRHPRAAAEQRPARAGCGRDRHRRSPSTVRASTRPRAPTCRSGTRRTAAALRSDAVSTSAVRVDERAAGLEPELRRTGTDHPAPQPDRRHEPAEDVTEVLDAQARGLEIGRAVFVARSAVDDRARRRRATTATGVREPSRRQTPSSRSSDAPRPQQRDRFGRVLDDVEEAHHRGRPGADRWCRRVGPHRADALAVRALARQVARCPRPRAPRPDPTRAAR